MMLKDGGVCGTMGAISARMHNTLGIPASQATQPGHCAMVAFLYDAKTKTYQCKGDQYATGGDEKTGPFTPWPFEREFKRTGRRGGYEISFHRRKPMVYHQTLAWGVNFGFRSWLDATIAHGVFQVLPKEQRESDGMKLLESGLVMNPYQSLLVDTAQETATTSQEQIRFFRHFQTTLRRAAGKPGCPTDGLYNTTVKNNMFNRISRLRIPKDKKSVSEILSFLEAEKCTHAKTLENYRRALK
jgi:hypothetical protein